MKRQLRYQYTVTNHTGDIRKVTVLTASGQRVSEPIAPSQDLVFRGIAGLVNPDPHLSIVRYDPSGAWCRLGTWFGALSERAWSRVHYHRSGAA